MLKPVFFSAGGAGKAVPEVFLEALPGRIAELERDININYKNQDQGEVGPEVLARVRQMLRDIGNPSRARHISREIGRIGSGAVPAVLMSCYLLRNDMARQAVQDILRELAAGDQEVVSWLRAGTAMRYDGAREVCLGALGGNMPASYLVGSLCNRAAPVTERAASGDRLCQLRHLEAIPHLAQFLADAGPASDFERVRVQHLAKNLGILGAPLLEPLFQAMQGCPRQNIENFFLAFGGTGAQGRAFLLEKFNPGAPRQEQINIIRSLGKQARRDGGAVDALLHLLTAHPYGDWRFAAVEELGRARLQEAVPALQGLLGDPDPDVRGRALTALAQLRCEDIIPVAEQYLSRPGLDLQAAEALACLGQERGLGHLLGEALKSAGDRRKRALFALGRLGAFAVDYLGSRLGSGDEALCLAAIEALGRAKGNTARDRAARALLGVFSWWTMQQNAAACHSLKLLQVSGRQVLRELERLSDGGRSPQEAAAREALEYLSRRDGRRGPGGIGERE